MNILWVQRVMEGISRLDLPARKMFLNDLQNAVQLHSVDSSYIDIKSWKTESNDTSFSIVWVQGCVSASIVGVVGQSCCIIYFYKINMINRIAMQSAELAALTSPLTGQLAALLTLRAKMLSAYCHMCHTTPELIQIVYSVFIRSTS